MSEHPYIYFVSYVHQRDNQLPVFKWTTYDSDVVIQDDEAIYKLQKHLASMESYQPFDISIISFQLLKVEN